MSELTKCNFCLLQEMKKRTEHRNKIDSQHRWVLTTMREYDLGGVDVFIHPGSIKIPKNHRDRAGELYARYRPFFVAWFMALSDHCEC